MIFKDNFEVVRKIQTILQWNVEYSKKIPIFINSLDRVSCLKQLTDCLSKTEYHTIIIIDNASTCPDIVTFLYQCSYPVIRLNENLVHIALWQINELKPIIRNESFVYIDPGVVPIEPCPSDVVDYLYKLSNKHPEYIKARFGLFLDDVPTEGEFVRYLSIKKDIKFVELPLWGIREIGSKEVYERYESSVSQTRPFNQLLTDNDKVIKKPLDAQEERLAKLESNWYEFVKKYRFDYIPEIFSFNPLVMERIDGKHPFDFVSYEEKRKVLFENT